MSKNQPLYCNSTHDEVFKLSYEDSYMMSYEDMGFQPNNNHGDSACIYEEMDIYEEFEDELKLNKNHDPTCEEEECKKDNFAMEENTAYEVPNTAIQSNGRSKRKKYRCRCIVAAVFVAVVIVALGAVSACTVFVLKSKSDNDSNCCGCDAGYAIDEGGTTCIGMYLWWLNLHLTNDYPNKLT